MDCGQRFSKKLTFFEYPLLPTVPTSGKKVVCTRIVRVDLSLSVALTVSALIYHFADRLAETAEIAK